MAKVEPSLAIPDMEDKLGNKISTITYPLDSSERFYSDLRPVPYNVYQKTRDEYEECQKSTCRRMPGLVQKEKLPVVGGAKVGGIYPLLL